jgi:hypothetical protein
MLGIAAIGLVVLFVKKTSREITAPIAAVSLMTVVYWLGLVAARFTIDTDQIYTRFTMPVYPLVVVVLILIISSAARTIHFKISYLMLVFITVASLAWSIKRYDFSAHAWSPNLSQRTQIIERITRPGDLLIGDGAREYNLFLGRTVLQLPSGSGTTPLSPELISQLAYRWSGRFDRVLLVLSSRLDASQYGQYVATLSSGVDNWTPVYRDTNIIVYVITSR